MGRLYVHISVSVDGFINDRDGGLQWWSADEQFNEYIDGVLDSIEAMVLGRAAYDALAQFWPSAGPELSATQRRRMHELPKYLLSHDAPDATWHNTQTLGPDPAAALSALARRAARDFAVFAGAGAAMSLLGSGVIDGLRLIVHPALVGSGTRLFDGGYAAQPLRLTELQRFDSGALVLHYELAPAQSH